MLKGQATATNTGGELAFELHQSLDALIKQALPLAGYLLPIAAIRSAAIWQAGEGIGNLAKAQPHPLRHPDEGYPAQRILRIEALAAIAAHAADQPFLLVKTQGTGIDPGALRYLTYG